MTNDFNILKCYELQSDSCNDGQIFLQCDSRKERDILQNLTKIKCDSKDSNDFL